MYIILRGDAPQVATSYMLLMLNVMQLLQQCGAVAQLLPVLSQQRRNGAKGTRYHVPLEKVFQLIFSYIRVFYDSITIIGLRSARHLLHIYKLRAVDHPGDVNTVYRRIHSRTLPPPKNNTGSSSKSETDSSLSIKSEPSRSLQPPVAASRRFKPRLCSGAKQATRVCIACAVSGIVNRVCAALQRSHALRSCLPGRFGRLQGCHESLKCRQRASQRFSSASTAAAANCQLCKFFCMPAMR